MFAMENIGLATDDGEVGKLYTGYDDYNSIATVSRKNKVFDLL